jgi:hypothetical protein
MVVSPPAALRRVVRMATPQRLRRRIATGVMSANTAGDRDRTVDESVGERLREEIADEVAALSALLGRDLSGWLEA